MSQLLVILHVQMSFGDPRSSSYLAIAPHRLSLFGETQLLSTSDHSVQRTYDLDPPA